LLASAPAQAPETAAIQLAEPAPAAEAATGGGDQEAPQEDAADTEQQNPAAEQPAEQPAAAADAPREAPGGFVAATPIRRVMDWARQVTGDPTLTWFCPEKQPK